MTGARIAWLPDRRRLHFHHGPIDLIVHAEGPEPAIRAAYARAAARFDGLLEELVAELLALRSPEPFEPRSPVARAMQDAVAPHRPAFVTPMAAVAGAVADEICAHLASVGDLTRAHVNNGGDIAFHLTPGTTLAAAIGTGLGDRATIRAADPVRGIATSGWRGRSHSLGIADAVTVLAATAAEADAAATLIANAVDLPGNLAIARRPACDLQADSDLGTRAVTVAVGPLSPCETNRALASGIALAESMLQRSLIRAAALYLAGQSRIVGHLAAAHRQPVLA